VCGKKSAPGFTVGRHEHNSWQSSSKRQRSQVPRAKGLTAGVELRGCEPAAARKTACGYNHVTKDAGRGVAVGSRKNTLGKNKKHSIAKRARNRLLQARRRVASWTGRKKTDGTRTESELKKKEACKKKKKSFPASTGETPTDKGSGRQSRDDKGNFGKQREAKEPVKETGRSYTRKAPMQDKKKIKCGPKGAVEGKVTVPTKKGPKQTARRQAAENKNNQEKHVNSTKKT